MKKRDRKKLLALLRMFRDKQNALAMHLATHCELHNKLVERVAEMDTRIEQLEARNKGKVN